MSYRKTVLPNGITVISDLMKGVRSVTVGLWFNIGTRDEAEDQAGIAHFMEHMMFKGTSKRSAFDISNEFDAMGAELNAFTSREYTCYYSRTVDDDLGKALEVLSDMVVNSTFSDEAICTEKEVVLEEIARADDTPDDVAFELFTNAMFSDHPLGLPVLGDSNQVRGFSRQDCVGFHKQNYVSGNMVIAAAGNVDHDYLVDLCNSCFRQIHVGGGINRTLQTQASRECLAVAQKDIEQAHVLYGMPFIPTNDPRRFAASVMSNILGGTMSSRLFQEVRENLGLAYSIFTNPNCYLDMGTFAVYAGTRPENITHVIEITRRELDKMAQDGPNHVELKNTVDGICGQLLLGLESTSGRMARIGRGVVQSTDLLTPEEVVDRYRSLTVADVLDIAQLILTQDPTIALVSPYSLDEINTMIDLAQSIICLKIDFFVDVRKKHDKSCSNWMSGPYGVCSS